MTPSFDNLVLAGLLAGVLLMLLLLVLVVAAARRDATHDGAAASAPLPAKVRRLRGESLRLSFRKAVRLIEKNLAARSERYNLSWSLLLNEGGEPLPLLEAGLPSALSADSSSGVSTPGIAWHFFDKGVVIQLRADDLGSPDDAAGSGVWDDLLGLCRAYRMQRPFDAIVLALPCAALLQDDGAGQLALVARAKAVHRRLWLAQNRLALRFPVHLVISGCEAIPGFARFGAALPEPQHRSILGWASPFELVAPYRSQWVDAALDQVVGSVADTCAELSAQEAGHADSSAYYLLPGQLERLRAGLKLFCDELMRPSAYHESFLLRGIYLSGDCSPEAALQADGAPRGTPVEVSRREPMPVFLRDVFERKIFAEAGLVRSSRQRMRHPAGRRLAWWAGLALPLLWACGLVVATFELGQQRAALLSWLQAVDVPARGGLADGAASQRRAMAALDGFEPLGGARFRSLLMPGSWPLFDDLDARLRNRLEQAFADNAVAALTDAARAQASQLTGVARDAVTGSLIENGQCALPARWQEQVAAAAPAGLNLKSLPEYGAILAYITRLDELDQALGAMQRLAQSGAAAPSGADLALAVRLLLNRELRGRPERTAALFRAAAQGAPLPSSVAIQQAARCSLKIVDVALYRRLFDENALLRTERAAADAARRLREEGRQGATLEAQLALWQKLGGALDEQQALLLGGQGGWMQQRVFDLGSAQDNIRTRIGANRLLGAAAVQDNRDFALQGFNRFLAAWDNTMTLPNPVDGGTGLAWTAAGWTFAPERKALRDAVAGLLAQPWMKTVAPVRLPAVPAGATVRWDRAQVERAAGLAELRKAFLAGPYAALPASLQQPAGVVADLALAAQARAALAQALLPAPRQLPGAAADAERAAVQRILAWLEEIGARELAAELDGVLAHDALSRLARLDEVFEAAQVYMPRDAAFQNWQGQKGALLDAYGGGDAAGLGAYLEQQQEFVDTIVQQSEGVLTELASGALANQPLVARWQALAADLRRYRLKSPTSSRMALESFITTGSADIDLGNCIDKLALRQPPRRANDVFAERLQSVQAGMLARCRELAGGDGQRQWQRFAEAYNRDLGRRAPFLMEPGAGTAGAAAADTVPADRDAVGAVMKLYDRARAAGALAARDAGQPGPRPEVRRADQQLRRVRELLAPLYPAEEGQAAGLDVAVEFRANTAAEAGASKIIDWSLGVGSATARMGGAATALRWEPGMPVVLSLRLARDAAVVPKREPGRPDMQVIDRTVTFRFDDPWALFSFVNAYRDADAGADDGRGALLRFEFPLAASGPVPAAAADTRARVFVRLRVSAPGKHAALAWPAVFPSQVPLWQDTQKVPL
jgi:type VI secretion system protein ImpL